MFRLHQRWAYLLSGKLKHYIHLPIMEDFGPEAEVN